jgi:hypothetical protein
MAGSDWDEENKGKGIVLVDLCKPYGINMAFQLLKTFAY